MFYQLLGGVQCHMAELIGREDNEEIVQARKSLPLLVSRCKMTANISTQEPFSEWMRTIDVFFNTRMVLKNFSHDNQLSHLLNVT